MSERGVWRHEEGKSWLTTLDEDRERYLKDSRETLRAVAWVVGACMLFGEYASMGMGFIAVALLLPSLRRRHVDVAPMLTLPLPAPAYACDLEVTDGTRALGRDRGIVTFVDGWLHFEGGRTTFSLSRRDVEKRDRNSLRLDGCEAVFLPDAPAKTPFGSASSFSSELDRWYRIERAAMGVSVLPPCEVHRTGRTRAQADLLAHALLAVGASALAVGLLRLGEPWSLVLAALAALRAWASLVEADGARRFLQKRSAFPNVSRGDRSP